MLHAAEAATDFSAEKVACYCMLDTVKPSAICLYAHL